MQSLLSRLAKDTWRIHATYNLTSGILPIVNLPIFEAISGKKIDRWLVRTVGALVMVNGAVIASAGARDRITPEVAALAIGSSASLATVDVYYVARGRISPIYLLDALAETLLIAGWVTHWQQSESDFHSR